MGNGRKLLQGVFWVIEMLFLLTKLGQKSIGARSSRSSRGNLLAVLTNESLNMLAARTQSVLGKADTTQTFFSRKAPGNLRRRRSGFFCLRDSFASVGNGFEGGNGITFILRSGTSV